MPKSIGLTIDMLNHARSVFDHETNLVEEESQRSPSHKLALSTIDEQDHFFLQISVEHYGNLPTTLNQFRRAVGRNRADVIAILDRKINANESPEIVDQCIGAKPIVRRVYKETLNSITNWKTPMRSKGVRAGDPTLEPVVK